MNLTERIEAAMSKALCHGLDHKASELFLGPSEVRELERHLWTLLSPPGMEPAGHVGIVDGKATYRGLTIRFLQNDGVRVGMTFEP